MMECIEWQGYCTQDGYGETRIGGTKVRIHRYTWQKANGPIPDNLVVRHKCDNPKCYNIEHLELGTTQENTQDRVERGRSATGESNGNVKLTEEIVLAIRASELSQRQIARQFGISQGVVSQVKSRKTWRHI